MKFRVKIWRDHIGYFKVYLEKKLGNLEFYRSRYMFSKFG